MALPIPTPRRRRGAWLVLIIFVLAIGGVMAAKAPALNEPTQVQGLPSNSQSYQAAAIQAGLPQASSQPAFVVYQSTSGQPLVQATQESLQQNASKLAHAAATADPASESIVLGPLKVSKDGTVAVSTISIATAPDDNAVASRITALRAEAAKVTPSSMSVNVTGGPAFTTDLADVFNGADTTLLIATALVVAVRPGANVPDLAALATPGVKVVMADKTVPAGKYGLTLLDNLAKSYGADYKANVTANVVSYETNVKAVLQKVTNGEADAGIVYASDVIALGDKIQVLTIPAESAVIAEYVAAPLRNAAANAPDFVDFITSDSAKPIWQKYGFNA